MIWHNNKLNLLIGCVILLLITFTFNILNKVENKLDKILNDQSRYWQELYNCGLSLTSCFENRKFKLFLFNNEEKFKKKIRLHLL